MKLIQALCMFLFSLVAVFVLLPVVDTQYVASAAKQKVPNSGAEADSKEQPAIVGHGDEHEEVAIPHLDHVECRLQGVHG